MTGPAAGAAAASTPGLTLIRLERLLASDRLSAGPRRTAEGLARRLSTPVRVIVAGPSGAGRSCLVNLMLGARRVPSPGPHPQLLIRHGAAGVTFSWPDGSVEAVAPGAVTRHADEPGLVAILTAGDRILDRISLGEPASGAGLDAAASLAATDADIVLWCSQAFTPEEQAAWAGVPDHVKDHAFFALTKADQLAAAGHLADRIAAISDRVGDEFHSLFPVATLQGLDACGDGGSVDGAMLRASGGAALIEEVMRHADEGRRADQDGALLFLERHREAEIGLPPIDEAPRPTPTPAPAPAAIQVQSPAPAPEPAPPPAAALPPHTPDPLIVRPAPTPVAPRAPAVALALAATTEPEPDPDTLALPISDLDEQALLAEAFETLRVRATELADFVALEGPDVVLPHCSETVEILSDLLADLTAPDGGDLARVAADVELASELLLLMQLERGGSPAEDAVSLLLQIRREVEIGLAA